MRNWMDQRVLIIGAARQGLALARFLVSRGAVVTLNDQRSSEKLSNAIDSLKDVPVQWALGGHPLDLLDHTDLVCLSGGVSLDMPLAAEAVAARHPLVE